MVVFKIGLKLALKALHGRHYFNFQTEKLEKLASNDLLSQGDYRGCVVFGCVAYRLQYVPVMVINVVVSVANKKVLSSADSGVYSPVLMQ